MALTPTTANPKWPPTFLKPLIDETARRRAKGENNLFNGHMLDASILPLEENLAISKEYLAYCKEQEIVLEIEAGVVGGEEDGSAGTEDMPDDKLYTTPEDMLAIYEALQVKVATCLQQLLVMFMPL